MDLSCAAIQVHIVDMCLNVFVVVLLPVISVVSFVFRDGLDLLLPTCGKTFFHSGYLHLACLQTTCFGQQVIKGEGIFA